MTVIDEAAFCGCSALEKIAIPAGVTEIGKFAFGQCSALQEICVSNNNTSYCSVDGVLFNKDKTAILACPAGIACDSYTVPDGVTCIGVGAFAGCNRLLSIVIPEGVTEISDTAFYYCVSLTEIAMPEGVRKIGMDAFMYCDTLEKIAIPDSVTEIGDAAFANCGSLTDITYKGSTYSSLDDFYADYPEFKPQEYFYDECS